MYTQFGWGLGTTPFHHPLLSTHLCLPTTSPPTLCKESRPMFNSNQAFLLVQKLKSAPNKLYTRSQGWNRKRSFQSAPKLLINAELYGPVLVSSSALFFWANFRNLTTQKKKKKKGLGNPTKGFLRFDFFLLEQASIYKRAFRSCHKLILAVSYYCLIFF